MDWAVFVWLILTNIMNLQTYEIRDTVEKVADTLMQDILPIESEEPQSPKILSIINIITMMVPNNISDNLSDCVQGDESCEDKTRTDQKKRFKKVLERRNYNHHPGHEAIINVPQYPEDLPAAEPMLPGHTLLRPSRGMLKSAVKFPLRDFGGAAVYGNLDNVGIPWGKINQRIRFSDFRKANGFMKALNNAVKKSKINNKARNDRALKHLIESQASEENNANEEPEEFYPMQRDRENANVLYGMRRSMKKSKSKFRDRGKYYLKQKNNDSESGVTDSEDEDHEKNPGNPYTIHKNKYLQNWIWNHEMDGDHMNINPYAPEFQSMGPSGNQLFFGRKWWYFNQDDFKPMRR